MKLAPRLLLLACASLLQTVVTQGATPVATQIPNLTVYGGAPPATLDLTQFFSDPQASSAVRMYTSAGQLDILLLDKAAPKTVANFLGYVQRGDYDGSFIHRLDPNFVLQGGGYRFVDNQVQTIPQKAPVPNEFGTSNTRGTIAMAKLNNDANSATNQWFFNLADNSANLDTQNGGFTVFGRLAAYSLPVLDTLAAYPTVNVGSPFDHLPVIGYRGGAVASENLVTVNRVTTIAVPLSSFTATSDNPQVVTPVLNTSDLLLKTDAAHLGTAHVTVSAQNFTGETMSQTFTVTVSAAPGRPVNISTRLDVRKADNVLIGGFIIVGNNPKKFMVRAIGPSLTAAGVANALANPVLELHDHTGALVASNDDWQQQNTDTQSIIESSIAPSDPRESVILTTLPPDSYTAIVRGKSDTTGIGLVEIYDLDSGPSSIVANISTRGHVDIGENVLIGGFIVAGTEAKKILVRGIGPSLAASGVPDALPDPTVEIHDGNGAVIDSNNDWQTSAQAAQIQASGIAPSDPKEAATLGTLAPGSYTAIVRGTGATPTGVALVEAYELQ